MKKFLKYVIFAAVIVILDQVSKYVTVANLDLYENISFIPGVLSFQYTQNTGAAWSSFEGQIWLFALVFALFTGLVIWEYFKKPLPFTALERWLIAAVYGGGLGNMIDRIRLGYVIDMIKTDFIVFPVFNVADCFISCGSILLLLHLIFFNKPFWKEEKK